VTGDATAASTTTGPRAHLRETVERALAAIVGGRPVVLVGAAASGRRLGAMLEASGASRVDYLALPVPEGADPRCRFMRLEAMLERPPASWQRRLEALDPAGRAWIYAGSFTARERVCGRPVLGGRRPVHYQSERKDRQLQYLAPPADAAGLLDLGDRQSASARVATAIRRCGVVLSGVPARGLALGASHTYRLERGADSKVETIVRALARTCGAAVLRRQDRGIPGTYYGFVTPHGVVDFGPFEALVYWDPVTGRMSAPGIARPVRPGRRRCAEARRAVRATAERLAAATGYRGAFCTDGVFTRDRYVVHEINARVCAGFALLGERARFPFAAADIVLREGRPQAVAATSEALRGIARALRRQQCVVKLWDPAQRELEQFLRSAVSGAACSDRWIRDVRRAVSPVGSVPWVEA
jgi:hypothetical protein